MNMKINRGFSIIELMIAIVIGGVLLAIAIPNYTTMVQNNCLTSKANAMVGAMQLARSSAITFHDDIIVAGLCKIDSNNDDIDDGVCASTDEFGGGMVIFRDFDGDGRADTSLLLDEDVNGNRQLDPGEDTNGNGILDTEEIIRMVNFTCPATIDETSNRVSFTYASNGSILPIVSFDICDERACTNGNGRRVTVSATGRPATIPHLTLP